MAGLMSRAKLASLALSAAAAAGVITAGPAAADASDDFPIPEGPTTAKTPVSLSLRRHDSTSASLPKNESASAASYGSNPR